MLRVTTLYASSSATSAEYYAGYLLDAPGEVPGVWSGRQAAGLGLSGTVDEHELASLLSGRDPVSETRLGTELLDRYRSDGKVIRAVSGYDATFSSPKALSVLWALTGDHRLLGAHDVAVAAALSHLERFGSTTRVRRDGRRLFPDTRGLTMATFRQTTSRAEDPQIHTHAVVSAKVQTVDGRWLALDGRYLKRQQRMLGGLYQSVLRAELSHHFGVAWDPIKEGQAEIAGVPPELLKVFSKRAATIEVALTEKVDEFRQRQGRNPSRWERAALTREASEDTRNRKSKLGAPELVRRWRTEAAALGWDAPTLVDSIDAAARDAALRRVDGLTVHGVIEAVSAEHSSWCRADVLRALGDVMRPASPIEGRHWLEVIEQRADRVLAQCVDLDPADATRRRMSDGRSEWIEPVAPRFTSEAVLAQEEHIITWAMDAQADEPAPSTTVQRNGLDVMQGEAAAAVAGDDRLVLVIGPAGAGKTRMLAAATADLAAHGQPVFGVAPTAKAARVLERDTHLHADTVAKLLYEWDHPDRPPGAEYRLPAGTTLLVDEAGTVSTPNLSQLVGLAESKRWRLVLVGDPRQLQAVGRGGLFAELCANGRVEHLEHLHRFTHRWEAAASLQLRSGDPVALDYYEYHDRIIPGSLVTHLDSMAQGWIGSHCRGETIALVASTNDHVDAINLTVQAARLARGHLNGDLYVNIAGGDHVYVGDVVATRRNDRRLVTTAGEVVRNRETWTVTAIHGDGSITATRKQGDGAVQLPVEYLARHVRLGYAATEHGYQSDTVTTAIALASPTTTRRGLYVAATRGRDENLICVVTASNEVAEARDVLEAVLAVDRGDVPAVTQRRTLAAAVPREVTYPPPAAPAPRCQVPDWFDPLLADTRRALAEAERSYGAYADEWDRRADRLTDAEAELDRVDVETSPARSRYASADYAVHDAEVEQRVAARLFAESGWRQRRPARRHLDEGDTKLTRARTLLGHVEREGAPAQQRHDEALRRVDDAREDLRHHELAHMLDRHLDPAPLQERVAALETWRDWADGAPVARAGVCQSIAVLRDGAEGDPTGRLRALHDVLRASAVEDGIALHPTIDRSPQISGPSLSL